MRDVKAIAFLLAILSLIIVLGLVEPYLNPDLGRGSRGIGDLLRSRN